MDWLGKMIGLPDDFLHSASKSEGGGVIQTTASESTFVCLLAGRTEAIRRYYKLTHPVGDDSFLRDPKLAETAPRETGENVDKLPSHTK